MPDQNDDGTRKEPGISSQKSTTGGRSSATHSIFTAPPALKRVFEKFPLVTYPTNQLPIRAPRSRKQNLLHVFTSAKDAPNGVPSFNPSCLKWQTYLHFNDIPFRTVASTNHASPSGSLPFVIPANASPTVVPITSSSLAKWISEQSPKPTAQSLSAVESAYNTLLTTPIRLAYLYALYLHPHSFDLIANPLYIRPASSSALVRYGLSQPLRAAALEEIFGASVSGPGKVDVERLFKEAEDAWEALSVYLGSMDWFAGATGRSSSPRLGNATERKFFDRKEAEPTSAADDEFEAQRSRQGDSERSLFEDAGEDELPVDQDGTSGRDQHGPDMLDAAVFAYSHVILNLFSDAVVPPTDAWSPPRRLYEGLQKRENLVQHRDRILKRYYA